MSVRFFRSGTPTSNRTVHDNDAGSSTSLLNMFPGATLCVGVTKENGSYAGPCMRVRRTSDNVEQNIGWVGKAADVSAFTTFIGGSTARLTVWYDQSGSGSDLLQATTSRQPAVVIEDGRLVVNFDGNGRGLSPDSSTVFKTAHTHVFAVVRCDPIKSLGPVLVSYTEGSNYRYASYFSFGDSSYPLHGTRNNVADGLTVHQGAWGAGSDTPVVFDWSTSSNEVRVCKHAVGAAGASTNVTYSSGTGTLRVGNSHTFNSGPIGRLHMLVLYGATKTERNDITNFIMSSVCLNLIDPLVYPFDGYVWNADLTAGWAKRPPDSHGLKWWPETPGCMYSLAYASVASGELVRLVAKENIPEWNDARERAERGCVFEDDSTVAVGDTIDMFVQWKVDGDWNKQTTSNSVSWNFIFQIHYNGGPAPDLFLCNMKNSLFQPGSQGDRANAGNQGIGVPYMTGEWYATRALLTWGADGVDDRFECWHGVNGTHLTKISDTSGDLFTSGAPGAFIKQGIYRGDLGTHGGTVGMMLANHRFIKNGEGGNFAAFITTQPHLPVAG